MRPYFIGHAAAMSAATFVIVGIFASRSDAQSPSLEQTVIKAFVGNCVLNLPNLEKIRAASRLFNWKPISGDAATIVGPLDPEAKSEAWLAREGTANILIGITTGNLGSQPVVTCTVGHPDLKQDAMLERLQKSLELKILNDEREASQRYRSWTTQVNGYSVLVTFTSMQDANLSGGSIAAAVKVK